MQWKFNWREILIELLVVFVGVSAAFYLGSIKEDENKTQLRENYYATFIGELQGTSATAKSLQNAINGMTSAFEESLKTGDKPKLKINDQLDFTINHLIVQSAFNSDNFGNVGSEYLVKISFGSNLISIIDKKVDNYKQNCQQLLYFDKYETDKFYTSDGQLKEEFQWYIDDLKSISDYLGYLIAAIDDGAIPETKQLLND